MAISDKEPQRAAYETLHGLYLEVVLF